MENYFELLGLKASFKIDPVELKANFLQKQLKFHPDRATTTQEERIFLEKSIRLNEAKKNIEDDYLRAKYLLKLANIELEIACRERPIDLNYLEEIVELNEQIITSGDVGFLQDLKQRKEQDKKQLILMIQEAFTGKNLVKALELTLQLKYLTNLVRNIDRNINYANY